MRVLVSGSSGLVGRTLLPHLGAAGHEVVRLVRRPPPLGPLEIAWDPAAGRLDSAALEGFDAAVHLSGESIAAGRWTEARRRVLRDSRILTTRLLAEALAHAARRPRVLVVASATGYYGGRGDAVLDESAPPGAGFLATLCRDWEAAAAPATEAGIRVVHLRTGVVLSGAGGALPALLPLFRLGLGGPLGSGRQFFPWIALDDLVRVVDFAIGDEALHGPVNATAPGEVTNAGFTRVLARVLRRPAFLPAPAFALRLVLGEFASEGLLSSQRVVPRRLLDAGFAFRHPELDGALRHALGGG
jgi:hypothetical protein